MTHTNHRSGTGAALLDDWLLLAMPARGINDGEAGAEKLRRVFTTMLRYTPVNGGGMNAGILLEKKAEDILRTISPETPMIHGVFADSQSFLETLRAITVAGLGLSVVATGPLEEIRRLAGQVGLTRHSVHLSLGVLGKRELLPPPEVLAVTTMCGHGMIGPALVESLLEDLMVRRLKMEDAVQEMGRQCVCGVFNPRRAARLLGETLAARQVDSGVSG